MQSFRKPFAFATVGLAFCAAGALAHGPQIQISLDPLTNQIVTRRLFPDGRYEPAGTPSQRVYEIHLAQRSLGDANDGWYAQPNPTYPFTGPGIANWQGNFATGSVLTLNFVDGLKLWDGSGFVDPGAEQADAYRGATRTAGGVTADGTPKAAFS